MKRRRKGLRGLGGTKAEHEHQAREFTSHAQHWRGRAMKSPTGACTAALNAHAWASKALAESEWTDGDAAARKLVKTTEQEARRHCGCKR